MMLSSSSSSATVAVDKATSDLLIVPDWTLNIDICDSVNSHHWHPKDVVKAVKKRLLHKSPKVQLLSLTLLETMVKNCGDFVHFQIADRNILGEMVKIVKKRADMQVRQKVLVLLDSWQEAFGGPAGKHPQYYWAYEELRRSGVEFPKRSSDAAPIFTPPVTHPTLRNDHAGFGMPSDSSTRLDEAMASEVESLSLSTLDAMRNVMELLGDMLQAVNPNDRMAVKDELIVDLVDRCRSNQKKLMHMLTTTRDEELLGHGLELNDSLQSLLAKHDGIASGSPLPAMTNSFSPQPTEASASTLKPMEVGEFSPTPTVNLSPPVVAAVVKSQVDEEEEDEDDFAQLARRHTKTSPTTLQRTSSVGDLSLVLVSTGDTTASSTSAVTSAASLSSALVLSDPHAVVRNTKEQDMIDLLSFNLSATSTSHIHDPPSIASTQSEQQVPVSTSMHGFSQPSQIYPETREQVPYNSYVVPWAEPQPTHQPRQYPQYSPSYPPPPWAATPGYLNNQYPSHWANNTSLTAQPNSIAHTYTQGVRPLQHHNSFPNKGIDGSATQGGLQGIQRPMNPAPSTGQKTFVPSYRLFEDLNVLGNDGRGKITNSTSSMAGSSGQGTVGGRK